MFQWNIWKWPWNYDKRYSLANLRFWNFVDMSVRSTLKKIVHFLSPTSQKKVTWAAGKTFFCLIQTKCYFLFPIKLKKNFMAPFYGWVSTASRLELLRGGSLPFSTRFPEIPGTHFINLGRMKGWVEHVATQWFWTGTPGLGIQCLNH